MQRHHLQMLIVFVVSLCSVLTLGPLWGIAIGVATALLLAPWSNPNLVRWLKHQGMGLIVDEGSDPKFAAEKEAAAWTPVARALYYAMDVEGQDVSVDIGKRDLSDQDIRHLVELDQDAQRAGVHFEVVEESKRPQEAVIDTALRRRAVKRIVLQR